MNAKNPFLRVAMSAEQTHERLGVAAGAMRGLQERLQRVSAGHQAANEALQNDLLRNKFFKREEEDKQGREEGKTRERKRKKGWSMGEWEDGSSSC